MMKKVVTNYIIARYGVLTKECMPYTSGGREGENDLDKLGGWVESAWLKGVGIGKLDEVEVWTSQFGSIAINTLEHS